MHTRQFPEPDYILLIFCSRSCNISSAPVAPTMSPGFRFPILGIRTSNETEATPVTPHCMWTHDRSQPASAYPILYLFRLYRNVLTSPSICFFGSIAIAPTSPAANTFFGTHSRVYNVRRARTALSFKGGYNLSSRAFFGRSHGLCPAKARAKPEQRAGTTFRTS